MPKDDWAKARTTDVARRMQSNEYKARNKQGKQESAQTPSARERFLYNGWCLLEDGIWIKKHPQWECACYKDDGWFAVVRMIPSQDVKTTEKFDEIMASRKAAFNIIFPQAAEKELPQRKKKKRHRYL